MRLIVCLVALFAASATPVCVVMTQAAETAEAQEVEVFGEGKLAIPADFKRVKPKMGMIEHEFEVTTGEGDDVTTGRVTMMGATGGIEPNIARWKGQFAGGNKEANKTEKLKVGKWDVYVVDLNGSFGVSMGGGPFSGGKVVQQPDYAMTAAILANPDGKTYFIKMIGPAPVVKANRDEFVKMVKNLK
ncbi:hypothetical protein [Rubripirellula reticaptiva]|uniref:Uncharacterized protein n=1 Tax=Rubripirellula reticaptiva TaxID=2528013 RepID=A0A5C6EPR0_9BACT|nr:hypothetical protein [Rubripirellula reticaptiva]TWU49591.1 hypothetical protein Poly59_42080 [Rubripirellula reticaptiva]